MIFGALILTQSWIFKTPLEDQQECETHSCLQKRNYPDDIYHKNKYARDLRLENLSGRERKITENIKMGGGMPIKIKYGHM